MPKFTRLVNDRATSNLPDWTVLASSNLVFCSLTHSLGNGCWGHSGKVRYGYSTLEELTQSMKETECNEVNAP